MQARIDTLKAALASLEGSTDPAAAGIRYNLKLQIGILTQALAGRKKGL